MKWGVRRQQKAQARLQKRASSYLGALERANKNPTYENVGNYGSKKYKFERANKKYVKKYGSDSVKYSNARKTKSGKAALDVQFKGQKKTTITSDSFIKNSSKGKTAAKKLFSDYMTEQQRRADSYADYERNRKKYEKRNKKTNNI